MTDREKVINGLREMSCRATWKDIDGVRHKFQSIINDALALLKEQEKEIRQLRLALDIAKGTRAWGIVMKGQ